MCHFEEPEPSQRYTILPLTEDTGYFMQWRVSLAALGLDDLLGDALRHLVVGVHLHGEHGTTLGLGTHPLIFILIQTCVHYAMFEDECYLQSQLEALKQAIRLLMTQYRTEDARPDVKAES